VFKTLVTRLVKSAKELRSQENVVRCVICYHTSSLCYIPYFYFVTYGD
jgi:hypothetical protein